MFFQWTNEIQENRDKMQQIIAKAKKENLPLKKLKKSLEQEGFDWEVVSSLSWISAELMSYLDLTEEEFEQLGYFKWIV